MGYEEGRPPLSQQSQAQAPRRVYVIASPQDLSLLDVAVGHNISNICEKILAGQRLSREDGLALMDSNHLLTLGYLARWVKERKTKDYVFFNVNRHLNMTNICVSRCKFCAFSRDRDDPDAYTMSVEEAVEKARSSLSLGITELHIVNGLHPDLPFSYYVETVRRLKKEFPHVHIQAFTAVEIKHFADLSGLSFQDVLLTLKEAGLGSLPGGGAEILDDGIRREVCSRKASTREWLEIMRTAHRLGFRSNATMLYGHIESPENRIDHLIKLRELQDETGGFQSFIPLPFHPKNTPLGKMMRVRRPTAYEDLKMLAISRLVLDNFDHIKAFWIMLDPKIAQLSLDFGVDDLDGTVVEEKITHSAGAETEEAMAKGELISMIREMGRTPVERDTLYNIIKVYG
jgi:aminodeoxyfutalosine synthase